MRRYLNLFIMTSVLASLLVAALFPPTVSASPLLAVSLAPTKIDTIIGDDGDGKADPGETIEYTIVIPNNGDTAATAVSFTDILDANITLQGGSVNVSPLAGDDTYTTIGNTLLEVGVAASGNPAVTISGSLFDNDTEFLSDTFELKSVEADTTTPFTTTTETAGGSVTVETNGSFSYTPPVGFSGVDHFDYVITDDGPDNIAGNADDLSCAGRVTIIVTSQRVWYVKNDSTAGGLGRSSDPFDTLAEAQTVSSAGDTIYIFQGNGTTSGQNAGITLKDGQRLLGEGVALTVPVSVNGGPNPTTLRAAGILPLIGNNAGNGVTLSTASASFSGVEIRGLDISGTGAGSNAVDVTTSSTFSGGFELANNVISNAGAEGIDINGGGTGTLTMSIHDNTVTATGNGIDIQRTAGSVVITTFDDNVVTSSSLAAGINVLGSGATVLFDANTSTAGYQQVLGGNTVIGQAGNGVGTSGIVLTNITGDISFTDLDIYADGGRALLINSTTPNFNAGTSTGFRLVANTGTPALVAIGGAALDVTDANINIVPTTFLSSITTATRGVSLLRVSGILTAPSGSSLTSANAGGTGFFVDGGSNANANVNVTYPGTITADIGRLVQIQNVTPAAAASYIFSGAITDNNDGDGSEQGISLANNTNATITFNGGLTVRTTTNAAFQATGGGIVNVCDENPCNPGATGALVNTLTSTTATALTFTSTTIGVNNLEFRSISATGAANGIVLNTTGSNGGLIVKGNGGACTSAATCTGGAIQNATVGILLNNTVSPSFDRMFINNTSSSGINGTQVNNFSLTNSTVSNTGTSGGAGLENSAVFFAKQSSANEQNLTGVVSITGNTLTAMKHHGISIANFAGTISNATISNNSITSPTMTATSTGTGIQLITFATNASTKASLTRATIHQNTVSNFPSDAGIMVQCQNPNESSTASTCGTDNSTNAVNITNNIISGQSAANRIGTQGILFNANGTVTAYFNVSGNSISHTAGNSISHNVFGDAVVNSTTSNNTVVSNNSLLSGGISGGIGATGGYTSNVPTLNWKIENNNVSATDGSGIRALTAVDDTDGTLNVTIRNNIVAQPVGNTQGIRVAHNGNVNADSNICLDISGNTSAGPGAFLGIGLRKAGTSTTVDTFGIEGLPAGSSSSPNVENYINSQNPSGGGTLLVSATSGFTSCNTAPLFAQAQPETNLVVQRQQVTPDSISANTLAVANGSIKQSVPDMGITSHNTAAHRSANSGSGKSLFRSTQPMLMQSGEEVEVSIGTLPAGKSVTIQFRVTVNDPTTTGTTQIINQGTVSGSNFSSVLTTNGGPVDCETGTETCTPVDRPDTTVISINRQTPSGANTNASSVTWRVTFASPVAGLIGSNFTLTDVGNSITGESVSTVTAVTGAPDMQWDVTVNTGTAGNGTLRLDLANDTGLSHDVTNAPYTSGQTYAIDKTAPTVLSIVRQSPASNSTNADLLVFRVTFSEPVTNVGASSFVVTGTTTTIDSAATTAITPNLVFDFYVDGSLNGDLSSLTGTVGLDVAASPSVKDLAGNTLQVIEPTPAATNDQTYTVDNTAPVATNFNRFNPATTPTNADTLIFQAIFSEDVTGVDGADFTVPALTGDTINVSPVSASIYEVTVSGGDLPNFNGLVDLNFVASPTITDLVGNALVSTIVSFDQHYVMDNTALTVAMTSTAPDPTNTLPIPVTIQFSKGVTGFDSGDITVGNATKSNFVAVDGDTYTFDLTPSGQGSVTADIAAGVAQDSIGNLNSAASQLSRTFDSVAPTVAMTSAASDPTNISPISVTAQFSENVTGFDAGDVAAGNSTVGNFVAVDGDTYTFDLTPSGQGSVTADIAGSVATDTAGNGNTAATQFSRTFDGDAPTVAMTSAAPNPTNTSPISVTVQFSEDVIDFVVGDIAASNGIVSNFIAVDGDTYTFDLAPIGQGSVTADIAAGAARDATGNPNSAASQFRRTFDSILPMVTVNQAAGQVDPTGNSSINFEVVFSEPVNGFDDGSSDVHLSGTAGAATAVITEVAPNDSTSYSIAVSGMTSSGTVIASIPADAAMDAAGNQNTASSSTDNTVTYIPDNIPPAVTINQAAGQSDPAIASTINFTAVFSEAVTNFATGDVTLSGTAGATTLFITQAAPNDGTTFNVAVSGMTSSGTVIVTIPAGVADDAAGNVNLASTSTDNVVTYSMFHGSDTTGVYRPSSGPLFLKNSNTTGIADVAINYGLPGDKPVVGDWDGDGDVTIGVYRNGTFFLRNSNTIGNADIVFSFGQPGDQPIAGDWDGDGDDTIGIYRPSTGQFLLKNSNSAGAADMNFYMGNVGDVGIAGDWNGDGKDSIGVFRPSNGVIFLKNTNASGFADIALNYGNPGDKPVTGDWNGDGIDTIGVYRSGTFYLRNANTVGIADVVFHLGISGDVPIAGNWDGTP